MSTRHGLGATALTLSMLVIGACGGAAAPTRPAPSSTSAAPSPSGVSPATVGTQPIPATGPTDAPEPSQEGAPTGAATHASPAATGGGTVLLPPTDPALFGTGMVPDGWAIVDDTTGTCRIAIPPRWTTGVAPGTGQTSVLAEAIASVTADTQDWEAYTQNVDQFYITGHTVLIDTDDVFLIASPLSTEADLSYLLGLRFDDTNCQALVVVQRHVIAPYAAQAALIAQTLDHK